MKEGDWIIYKNENFNIYKISNVIVTLHPETDDGFSNGSLIDVSFDELLKQEEESR